jgi:hypothetical protein
MQDRFYSLNVESKQQVVRDDITGEESFRSFVHFHWCVFLGRVVVHRLRLLVPGTQKTVPENGAENLP